MELLFSKIGLGGGCHWCTEGVFLSLNGVQKVEQGWIASDGENEDLSEAIIVHFDPKLIPLKVLVNIHLLTHSSTNNHSKREKYRSAIYCFDDCQQEKLNRILVEIQKTQQELIITQILRFESFKLNIQEQLNYFYSNPDLPFCANYITPKLHLLQEQYGQHLNDKSIKILNKT